MATTMATAMTATTPSDSVTRIWGMSSLRSALPSLPSSSLRIPSSSRSSRPPLALRLPTSSSPSPLNLNLIPAFSGLSSLNVNPLLSLSLPEWQSFEKGFKMVDGGGRVYAMRHGRRVPKLNRPPDQRKALLRGLTTQLLKHGRIKTTRARASAMRKFVDKMITLAKEGSLHKSRQALGFIYEKQIVHALFAEVPERYGERNGGYTRIIRTLPRRGDNAPMAYIELV